MTSKPMSSKSIMICTPCFGGQLTYQYVLSLSETIINFAQAGISYGMFLLANESLIQRARNKCAHAALQSSATHLLFIDADIGWKWSDLEKLIQAERPLIGGTYPVKEYPLQLNYNTLARDRKRSPEDLKSQVSLAGGQPIMEVYHIPTGFMLIEIDLLRHLAPHMRTYQTIDMFTKKPEIYQDFFPAGVTPDGNFASEDWGFCELVRAHGEKVWLHSEVILSHTGTHTFSIK